MDKVLKFMLKVFLVMFLGILLIEFGIIVVAIAARAIPVLVCVGILGYVLYKMGRSVGWFKPKEKLTFQIEDIKETKSETSARPWSTDVK